MARHPIILQARAGSSRLPGKVLKPLGGKPMLAWIVERLRAMKRGGPLVIATSDKPADDAVAALGASLGVEVFRGSESDVLDRYYRCAKEKGFSTVVRATGDNPFVDPNEGDRLLELFETKSWDYASAFPGFGSGLPSGVGLEIMTFAALERSWKEGKKPHHREHVNEYIQENPALFKQGVLKAPAEKTAPAASLTVDTPEDFARAEKLYAAYQKERPGQSPPAAWAIAASPRIGFSTFADHQMGMGHAYRCLRLRDAFAAAWPGASFVFELEPGREGFDLIGKNRPGEARPADHAGPWDVLVVDRLEVSPAEMRSLKKGARVLVSLDDAGAGRWEADLAFNALYAAKAPKPAGSPAEARDGFDSLFLDPAFSRIKKTAGPVRRILLSQGGADTYGLVPKLLEGLAPWLKVNPGVAVEALIGPAFRHETELAAALAKCGGAASAARGTDDMPALFAKADLAISGAGLVACELAAAGVPTLLVTGERKELETAAALAARGAAIDLGYFDGEAPARVARAVEGLALDAGRRERLSASAQKAIDGKGLERLTSALRARLGGS